MEFNPRVGEKARYTCDPGQLLVGEETRLCLANGEWDGAAPLCVTPCPDLQDPLNGTVTQNGTAPGSTACYTCREGFQPSSNTPCRTCSMDGEWSGLEIICRSKDQAMKIDAS